MSNTIALLTQCHWFQEDGYNLEKLKQSVEEVVKQDNIRPERARQY